MPTFNFFASIMRTSFMLFADVDSVDRGHGTVVRERGREGREGAL